MALSVTLATGITMNKKPGLVVDHRYFDHGIGSPSLENPERIRNLYLTLDSPAYNGRFKRYQGREAAMDEVLAVHSQFYIDQVREYAVHDNPYDYDRDTYLMADSLYTARLAAGGCMSLADDIMGGDIDAGFALVRPPGHHAEPGRGMGFCVLNSAAITAAYLERVYGLTRILICDIDVHHGNGTQEIFYDSNRVLVASLHQNDIFPFSGKTDELGRDLGLGYNVNVPVYPQFGDSEYTYLMGQLINTLVEQFLPQIIIVSAGYDGHADDPISKTLLTTRWFARATHMFRQFARDACRNRLLFILEGGYNPVALEAGVLASLESLLDPNIPRIGIAAAERAQRILAHHPARTFWSW